MFVLEARVSLHPHPEPVSLNVHGIFIERQGSPW